jgi:serine protease Do
MKHITLLLIGGGLMAATMLHAQTIQKEEKKEITIEKKEGAKKEKMVIEIDGDKIMINGQPAEEYKGKERIIIDEDIIINGNRVVVPEMRGRVFRGPSGPDRPLLGVTTENATKGVKINSVSKESGAEKAGLLEGDIITHADGAEIKTPEELTQVISKKKPGDEIDITYLRTGKTKKVKATLGKSSNSYSITTEDFSFDFDGPRSFSIPPIPEMPFEFREGMRGFTYQSDRPKYGMSIQDDEDGNGVKVTGIEKESNAEKAGLIENDIITEIGGKPVKNVDTAREILGMNKDEVSIPLKVLRNGVPQNLTIKVPRKLKTANL